ncbi:PAS domain-containing protein [Jonesia quinghaiensis]|uniref:PAS domain-containing protein n=1 Tax=Jonesia quinghaiensis TaxID=262806 RepID=UPI00040D1E6C|nr:PAS domain-containing protein [Jonesia quinghaiensis]
MTGVARTGEERILAPQDIIVTKTDLKGRITYANSVFLDISDLQESEALGKPHNIIRHPDMPAGVYKLVWDSLETNNEVFAYVKNQATSGAYYWVLAYVTPTYDAQGKRIGYHSSRRAINRQVLRTVEDTYRAMRAAEHGLTGRARGEASYARLEETLAQAGMTYSQWFWSLTTGVAA